MRTPVTVKAIASGLFLSAVLVLTTSAWMGESVAASKPEAVGASTAYEAQSDSTVGAARAGQVRETLSRKLGTKGVDVEAKNGADTPISTMNLKGEKQSVARMVCPHCSPPDIYCCNRVCQSIPCR